MGRLLFVVCLALVGCTLPGSPRFPPGPEVLGSAVILRYSDGGCHCAGVLVPEGVLTAAHCDQNEPPGKACTESGVCSGLTLIRADRGSDLALYRAEPALEGPRAWATPEVPHRGTMLALVGCPAGVPFVVHTGPVSVEGTYNGKTLAQVDLSPGFSGGPAFDAGGRLVGIAHGYRASVDLGTLTIERVYSLSFLIPARDVWRFLHPD